jgi:hypothetical protein
MDEDDRRVGWIACGADGELGPIERSDRSEIVERELGQVFVGFGVDPASRVQYGAPDHAARDRAGGDAGGDQGRAFAAHRGGPFAAWYSRGTRPPIPVAI